LKEESVSSTKPIIFSPQLQKQHVQTLSVFLQNILLSPAPLYRIAKWAHPKRIDKSAFGQRCRRPAGSLAAEGVFVEDGAVGVDGAHGGAIAAEIHAQEMMPALEAGYLGYVASAVVAVFQPGPAAAGDDAR